MAFFLGTSGYAYDEWMGGIFYPEGLKRRISCGTTRPGSARRSTTRSEGTRASARLDAWVEHRRGFLFTLKANQQITHWPPACRRRRAGGAPSLEGSSRRPGRTGSASSCSSARPTWRLDRDSGSRRSSTCLPDGVRCAMELRAPVVGGTRGTWALLGTRRGVGVPRKERGQGRARRTHAWRLVRLPPSPPGGSTCSEEELARVGRTDPGRNVIGGPQRLLLLQARGQDVGIVLLGQAGDSALPGQWQSTFRPGGTVADK